MCGTGRFSEFHKLTCDLIYPVFPETAQAALCWNTGSGTEFTVNKTLLDNDVRSLYIEIILTAWSVHTRAECK